MYINVNCKQNDSGAWCKDKRVKRSLFGLGARCCVVYNGGICKFQEKYEKPILKINHETKSQN